MSVKTNDLKFIQILFFSGILFLSFHTQAQESENQAPETENPEISENQAPTAENPRTIDSIEKNTTKEVKDILTAQNTQTGETKTKEVKTDKSKTNTDKTTKDSEKKQTPAPTEKSSDKKTTETKDKSTDSKAKTKTRDNTQNAKQTNETKTGDVKTQNKSTDDRAKTNADKTKNGKKPQPTQNTQTGETKTKEVKTDKSKTNTDKTTKDSEKKQTPAPTEKSSDKKTTETKTKEAKTQDKPTDDKAKTKTEEKTQNIKQAGEKDQTSQQANETKGVEPKKEKTTLEYEAQQIKGNTRTEKPEPKQEPQAREKKEAGPSVVVSRRSVQARSPFRSPVPVDVIDNSNLITFGNTVDLTDQLNTLVPSYMASPATVKNTAFVRPTSMRGMAGDQTLVLVNGKRRHRSALVQEFGPLTNRGSHGIDIAMIPTIALKNVEILRGGASAQYGSDAMAGVINFNLKENPDNASIQATYGQFFEGERSWRVGANLGLALLDNHGFANFSFDTNEAQGHSRGEQDKRASRLISIRGENNGIGNDAIYDDSPLVNSWGRPEKNSTRFMLNSELQLNSNTNVYLFGNYAIARDRIRLLYRDTEDPAFMGNSRWSDNLNEPRRTGFSPFLNGEQQDFSAFLGLKGEVFQNTTYDFSGGFGSNTLYQRLKNSLNPDSQLYYGAAQREFNLGSYKHQEQTFNADFSTTIDKDAKTHVSYGLEYREELFGQYAGSVSSFTGRGPSGMMGISNLEAGEYARSHYSAYIDLEHIFRKSMFIQYSLRYDNFSDFGETTNNKIASLITLTPYLSLRGSFSTNFRAPTLGQSHLSSTITNESMSFLETNQYNHTQPNIINIPANSHDVADFGATPLQEETSTDISVGLVSKISDNSHVSLDGYSVTINDRIYKNTIKKGTYENNVSFFANALDLRHQGLDLSWTTDLSKNISFANILLNVAYNYNIIDVIDNKFIGGYRALTAQQVEDMENNYPNHNFVFTANTQIKKFGFMARARYIGDHYGEVGTIKKKSEKEEGYNDSQLSRKINSTVYLDLELSYKPTKEFTFVLGGANILDEYPQRMTAPYANLMDFGMPYSRQTVANYEGGSWYLRMVYDF